MSGHSKWKNIMHKKEKTDAQKAKVFTKIGKEIQIAVREGGPDPVSNTKLRDLIQKAKSLNVPNDNIERTIKKASGADAAAIAKAEAEAADLKAKAEVENARKNEIATATIANAKALSWEASAKLLEEMKTKYPKLYAKYIEPEEEKMSKNPKIVGEKDKK